MSFDNDEVKKFFINFFTAGGVAVIAKTIAAPLDRVKLILQNQKSSLQILTNERRLYSGIIDCFVRLPKEQGFGSLWRGNSINLIRYFPTQALNFSFFQFFEKKFISVIGNESTSRIYCVKILSGGLSGACTTSLIYPLEFCQTRISADVGSDKHIKNNKVAREFSGLPDCLSKVCKSEGYSGLYRGIGIAVAGTAVYRAIYFSLFDAFKRLWTKQSLQSHQQVTKPPIYISFMMAQSVTITAGSLTYALDTVGRRLMMEAGRPAHLKMFDTTWGAIKHIYRNDGGIYGLYRGVGANCLRGISGALVLIMFDEVSHRINK